MDKQTIEQQEGVAALDRCHHDTATDTHRLCCSMSNSLKAITASIITLVLLVVGAIFGALYVYKSGPSFFGLVPESYGNKSYVALAAEVENFGWLWHSHNLVIALVEDDHNVLEKSHKGRNGKVESCWQFFREHATTARMKGFLKIIHDGQHPNLEAWYGRIEAGFTELEQLRSQRIILMEQKEEFRSQNMILMEQKEELGRLRKKFLEGPEGPEGASGN